MDTLLEMLIDSDYITGEVICDKLKMTRAAVWKRIEKLRKDGYVIEGVNKKGYCLQGVSNSILPAIIKKELKTKWAGRGEIVYSKEMTSTNRIAKEKGHEGLPHGSVVICEHQTAGKGRLGRVWDDESGVALTHTLLLRPNLAIEQVALCTLACALSMAEAIETIAPSVEVGIKWPNDLIINGKKCAGILSEMTADMDGLQFLILGVGVNVNQSSFSEELQDKAISISMATNGQIHCRRELLLAYLKQIEIHMDELCSDGLSAMMDSYSKRSATLGKVVNVIGMKESFIGEAISIDDTGALIVKDEQGENRRVLAGDVSVRGLLGYV